MSKVVYCVNPLQKVKHKCVHKNLSKVTDKWNSKFKTLIGHFVCDSCKRAINKKSENELNIIVPEKNMAITTDSESSSDENIISSDEDLDPTYKSYKKDLTIEKLNEILIKCGEPALKRRRSSPNVEKKDLNRVLNKIKDNLANKSTNEPSESDMFYQSYVDNIKAALLEKTSRADKIQVLTSLPEAWSISKIRSLFNVSRRMVSQAKKLKKIVVMGPGR